MKSRFNFPLSTSIAIAFGLVVLLGYFLNIPSLGTLRDIFVRWAMILAAAALLVGVFHLAVVHWRKATSGRKGSFNSLVLIVVLILTVVVVGLFHPTGKWSLWIFNYIQVPAETTLMAILAVVLTYSLSRLLIRRPTLFTFIFAATVLIVLLGSVTLPYFNLTNFADLRDWLKQLPAVAGARGILLGVALGTLTAGLRILLGADRPYGG